MPIFDNELVNNTSERSVTPERPYLGSPDIREVEVSLNPVAAPLQVKSNTVERQGASIDEISKLATAPSKPGTFNSPMEVVTRGELDENKKYPIYQREIDLENVYGLKQSGWNQLANGVVKMAATGIGTFAQSFATIPNTVKAIKNGELSELSGNPDGYEGTIDNWLKNIEDKFPNYYTRIERQHPFRAAIPFTHGSANFWGDKVIKNLGFTIGAIGGALVQDAIIGAVTSGIGEIPLMSAQVGRAALWLNKIFTGVNDLDKVLDQARAVGVTGKALLDMKQLGQIAAATRLTTGLRYGMNIYGSARTEAGVEARDGYRQAREEMIKQYKLEHGDEEPSGQDMAEIEKYATDAMNVRFGINMALLTVSNAIQFDNLFRTFGKATEKSLTSTISNKVADAGKIGLKEGSLDVFESAAAKGIGSKIWEVVKPKLPLVFSEGVYEEGGQYAAERGTLDYYTRKYQKKDNLQSWQTLNEVIDSTTKGLQEQFGTDEGLENMFIGAISALITGGAMGKIEKMRGGGTDARRQAVLNSLNQYGLTGNFANKYADVANTVAIAKEMQDAINEKDVFKYKNLKNDMFFNFVNSRIASGMHDVTIEQLNMLKDLGKEDFEQTFGMSFDESSKKTVGAYVDALVTKANQIKDTVEALNNTFKNPFKHIVNPIDEEQLLETAQHNAFNVWKTELARIATVAPEAETRIQAIGEKLMAIHPLLTTDLVSRLTNEKGLNELSQEYETAANDLTSLLTITTDPQEKLKLRNKIKKLRTMSERAMLLVQNKEAFTSFSELLNFELNGQEDTATKVVPLEKTQEVFNYGRDVARLNQNKINAQKAFEYLSNKKGFEKYFKETREKANEEPPVATPTTAANAHVFKNKAGDDETLEIGREYEAPKAKLAKFVQISPDRYKVTDAKGKSTFHITIDEVKTKLDELNGDLVDKAKLKVIALNPNGTVKVEDLAGNIMNIPVNQLTGYSKVQTAEERMLKDKAQMDAQQDAILDSTGSIFTNDPNQDYKVFEEPLKAADKFFASSITESETYDKPELSAAHIVRSREFLNNAKNFKNRDKLGAILVTINNEESLGLAGLTKLSYGNNSMTDAANVETGLVAQVYVVEDKGKTHFVDKDGKAIGLVGKQVDLSKVVFQTMPTPKLMDSRNNPRYRANQKDEFIAYMNAWKEVRKQIFAAPKGQYKVYKFSISRGIPIEIIKEGKREQNHIGGLLIPENKIATQEDLIQIAIDQNITHLGDNLKFPNGRPVLKYQDTLVFLANTKFTNQKAKSIYEVIKAYVEDIQQQSKEGKKIILNVSYANFLKNVLYYGKEGTKNRFKINTSTMSIILGNLNIPMSEVANREAEIIAELTNIYHNINRYTLQGSKFHEKFIEYVYTKDGLKEVEWRNYQSYLLSSTNPNKSARSTDETPLVTSVAKPTAAKAYSFIAKYSTLIDFELPIQEVPKPVQTPPSKPAKKSDEKKEARKVGEFTEGVTNTYNGLASGPVEFTFTIDSDNKININVPGTQPIIAKIAANDAVVKGTIIPILKQKMGADFQENLPNADYVVLFAGARILAELKTLRESEQPSVVPETPIAHEEPEVSQEAEDNEGTDEYDPDEVEPPDDDYRRVNRLDNSEAISETEWELFRAYVKEVVPNMPYEVLENIITTYDNEPAWGVFENGVAKIFKGAARGTEYHEIFEGIWSAFLSPEERQSLLDEFKAKKGTFKDLYSGKDIKYSDATDNQAKERIADDFAEYRLGKLPARTLGEKIARFFRNIMEFFKQFVTKPSQKTELFRAIDLGRFKNETISESVKQKAPEYKKIPNVTETQAFELVQDMAARTANFIFGEDKKSLYDIQQITGKEIYDKIKTAYIKEKKYQQLGEKSFNELFKRNKNFLKTLGINFNEEDRVDINDAERSHKAYADDPFTTDWKKTSPFAIKITAALLPVVEPTNQQGANSLKLPVRLISEQGKGYVLNNFSRVFATLLGKLSNSTSLSVVTQKLLDLAKNDGNYVRFFQRVGGNLATGEFNFSEFKYEDWRLFIDFYQVFTKQRPDAVIQYVSADNKVYTASADIYGVSKALQNEWFKNMRTNSKNPHSIVFWNSKTKTYSVKDLKATIKQVSQGWEVTDYNGDVLLYTTESAAKAAATRLSFPVRSVKDMLKFLNNLGIDIPMEGYLKLTDKEKDIFASTVSFIRTYIEKNPEIGTLNGRTLGISDRIATLANIYVKVTNPNQENVHVNVAGTKSQNYENNNYPSVFENNFNESENLDNLLESRPELNDPFSKHSVVLKKGELFFNDDGDIIKSMKVSHIEGTLDMDLNKGTSIDKLSRGNRFTQELNQNLLGNYNILIPADSSREWMLNLGNIISFEETQGNGAKAWSKVYQIFRGYLSDDIALALDADNRQILKNIGSKAKDLRFFKDILSEVDKDGKLVPMKILNEINKMIANEATQEQIEEYIDKHLPTINKAIKQFITEKVEVTMRILTNTDQVQLQKDGSYSYPHLNDIFVGEKRTNPIDKSRLTETDLSNILTFININYVINNIEFHKILFGDPYQFAIKNGKLEETKRIKSFISPRKTTFDSPEFNSFLNEEFNSVDSIDLSPEDVGYHEFKSYANTVTLEDIVLDTDLYQGFKETDGASFLMDNCYREINIKNDQWTTEAEIWHQWQMAYTRKHFPGYKYTNDALKAHDEALLKTREPKFKTHILKPIVSGTIQNGNKINLVIDKFSQMPLYYKTVQGTNLEKLYVKMMKEKMDYAVFESGRKVGTQAVHSLYNENKEFNTDPFEDASKVQVPWKIYGIQVETAHEGETEQTRGSQITKIVSMDLFENGQPISQEAQDIYAYNIEMLDLIHEHGYKTLLKKFGLDEQFNLVDPRAIAETLQHELLRRQLSNNATATIEIDEETGQFILPFEASPVYKQIKDIVYSIIHKSLISIKTSGGPKVQAPVTLWENSTEGRGLVLKTDDGWVKITREQYNALSEEEKQNVRLTSDTLKFYKNEDGKRYCEVMMPHWFKDMFDRKRFPTDQSIIDYFNRTDPSVLMGVGFRIPTQAMSSAEVFKVVGFLPQSMGDAIIVPSEITAKTNSDFDIDKLNTYLKSVYKDANGEIKRVTYKGSEEATKAFYSEVYDNVIGKQIARIEEFDDFRDKLIEVFDIIESIEDVQAGALRTRLNEEQQNFVDHHQDLLNEIIDQAVEEGLSPANYIRSQIDMLSDAKLKLFEKLFNEKLRDNYLDKMYRKALENEYYSSLEELISLPENFNNLTSPVSDAGLSVVAEHLDEMRGESEFNIKNRILDRNYMTNLRHAFITGKRWIGIAAVNITGHSLAQKIKLYIDPKRIAKQKKDVRAILKDGSIILPHNKVIVNNKEMVSLSGIMTADGTDRISNRLSGYATSFVDVANDPYILKIITSDILVGTFMFLERIGAGNTGVMFMNQPIIQEYIQYLDSIGYRYLYKKSNIDFIKNKFITTKQDIMNSAIDVNHLEQNITEYYKNRKFEDSRDNAVQHLILDEFLKYAKMAEFSFKFSQAINYDTTKFKTAEGFERKNTKSEGAKTLNIISSVNKLLDGTFIGIQKDFLSSAVSAVGGFMKLEQERFRAITEEVLKPYEEKEFMSEDDFDKVASKVKSSFLDYVVQIKTNLNDQVYELTSGDNSVANQLRQLIEKRPELKILQDLSIVSSERMDSPETIKLRVNIKDAYDENLYIEMMHELKELEPEFYNNLVKLAILQGSYQTSVSIKNIIPIEDYAAIIKPVIDSLNATPEVNFFSRGAFQRNNWKDDTVVPTYNPVFFGDVEYGEEHYPFEDEEGHEIYKYKSPVFPLNQFNRYNRAVMTIDPIYNPLQVQYDFLKVPSIITARDGRQISFLSGESIPPVEFIRRKAAGDTRFKEKFGYQKVKHSDGTPLLTPKGEYVYKIINLWGDGQFVSEYYTDGRKSVLNNGTVKVDEIADADIIEFYTPKSGQRIVEDVEAEVIEDEFEEETEEIQPKMLEQDTEGEPKTIHNDLATLVEEFGELNLNKVINELAPNILYIDVIDINDNVTDSFRVESYQHIIGAKEEVAENRDNDYDDFKEFRYQIINETFDPVTDEMTEEELISYFSPRMAQIQPTLFDKTQLEIPFEEPTKIVTSQSKDDNWKDEDNSCPVPF